MERLHHNSYGFGSELPEFPQGNSGTQQPTTGQDPWPGAAAFYATEAYMGLSRYDLQQDAAAFNNYGDDQLQMPRTNLIFRPINGSYRNDHERLLMLEQKLLGDTNDTNMITTPSPHFNPIHHLRVSLISYYSDTDIDYLANLLSAGLAECVCCISFCQHECVRAASCSSKWKRCWIEQDED